jgi:Holliday junction DNA helicase RuvB
VRDFAEVRADGTVDAAVARDALALFEVDELGLDKVDRAILRALCVTFAGRPVGLSTLAATVGEEPDTVEDVYEPFLLQQGLLHRTPRGRVATRPRARTSARSRVPGTPDGARRDPPPGTGRPRANVTPARSTVRVAVGARDHP